jgi:hypothetical protein
MEAKDIIAEAIARRKCVRSTYNGDEVLLAPHVLYTHHDEYFVDAETIQRNGAPPKIVKLGVFKLIGLKALALDGLPFVPMRKFNANDEKYKDAVVTAV